MGTSKSTRSGHDQLLGRMPIGVVLPHPIKGTIFAKEPLNGNFADPRQTRDHHQGRVCWPIRVAFDQAMDLLLLSLNAQVAQAGRNLHRAEPRVVHRALQSRAEIGNKTPAILSNVHTKIVAYKLLNR